MCHESFYDSSKRSVVRNLKKIEEEQKYTKGRIWYDVTYEHFMGEGIVIRNHSEKLTKEELDKVNDKIEKQRILTM